MRTLALLSSCLLVTVIAGCGPAKDAEGEKKKDTEAEKKAEPAKAEPAKAEPAKTEAVKAEPTPIEPAEPVPEPADAAGEGFSLGPAPKHVPLDGAEPDSHTKSSSHAGVTVSVHAHAEPSKDDEYEYSTLMQVRVELGELGLNYAGGGGDDYCDGLVADLQEIATLPDGRWIVDAQLACAAGEDYFSATNAHAVISIDPARPHVEVVWTGKDTGSEAMGVCSSSSHNSFVMEGTTLVVSNTSEVTLDVELAKELPEGAEGCVPQANKTEEVARVELAAKG